MHSFLGNIVSLPKEGLLVQPSLLPSSRSSGQGMCRSDESSWSHRIFPEASRRWQQAKPTNSFFAVAGLHAPLRSLSEQNPTELLPPVGKLCGCQGRRSEDRDDERPTHDVATRQLSPTQNVFSTKFHHVSIVFILSPSQKASSPPQHAALPSDLLIRWSCPCICTRFHASPLAKRLNGPRCKNLRW